mmetsp:Transcript_39759/g.64151  ORF Transcript_39759/g.64151 Transcript_39759/m.64151 type:complete len:274 (+) Transcript_39759:804-1625(+)
MCAAPPATISVIRCGASSVIRIPMPTNLARRIDSSAKRKVTASSSLRAVSASSSPCRRSISLKSCSICEYRLATSAVAWRPLDSRSRSRSSSCACNFFVRWSFSSCAILRSIFSLSISNVVRSLSACAFCRVLVSSRTSFSLSPSSSCIASRDSSNLRSRSSELAPFARNWQRNSSTCFDMAAVMQSVSVLYFSSNASLAAWHCSCSANRVLSSSSNATSLMAIIAALSTSVLRNSARCFATPSSISPMCFFTNFSNLTSFFANDASYSLSLL